MEIIERQPMLDPFFSQETCVNRLLKEWDQYGKLIVAYDFDDTVRAKDNGAPCKQMIELLQACKEAGCTMIVFTARSVDDHKMVLDYLDKYHVPYDYINQNDPTVTINESRKIFYNIFFDDRCALASTYEIMVRVLDRKLKKAGE